MIPYRSWRPIAAALLCTLCASRSTGISGRRPNADRPVTLVAVGDLCFAGGVDRAYDRSARGYPFAHIADVLRKADIAFGNLECVLSNRGSPVPKRYNFRGRPAWAARIREAGFDIVSMANNHTQDYGRAAMMDTIQALRSASVRSVGAGATLTEARKLQTITVRGLRVGFLAYLGMFPPILPIVADRPSVAMGYPDRVATDVRRARGRVDVLVVSLHAGVEGSLVPSSRQREIAFAAVDAGADLILGHHPHVVQPIVKRGKATIAYSLGNCVFNPSPSFLKNPKGPWSAMCIADLRKGQPVRARLEPLRIVDRQPRRITANRRVERASDR